MSKVNIGIETSSWINIAAGITVGAVGYYETSTNDTPFLSALGAGALLVAIGAYTAWAAATGRSQTAKWPSGGSVLVGLALVAYPWFLSVTDAYLYTMVAAGVIVTGVSAYEMWAAKDASPTRERPTM